MRVAASGASGLEIDNAVVVYWAAKITGESGVGGGWVRLASGVW